MKKLSQNQLEDEINQTPQDKFLIRFKLSVELTKALLWPAVTIFIFLSIKTPLLSVLSELPEILSRTTHISVGGVSLEQRLKDADVQPDVRNSLKTLSPEALRLLVSKGKIGFGYLKENWKQTDSDAPAINELLKNGLVTVTKSKAGEAYPIRMTLTDIGKKAYNTMLGILVSQLNMESKTSIIND